MNWIEVKTDKDIEKLLNTFGYFHDSCLKELVMWTDGFVDENLSMIMGTVTNIRILFQRQFRAPAAIELLFEDVAQFHLIPRSANYDSLILDAKLILHNGLFYWANTYDWEPTNANTDSANWISSRKLKWRDTSNWMGKENRYGVKKEI